jgi:hypothetical protein
MWLVQEVSDEKDVEYCEQLNEFVNNPQAAAQASGGGAMGAGDGEGGAGGNGMAQGGVDPQFLQQLFPGLNPGFSFSEGGSSNAGSRPASSASATSSAGGSSQVRTAACLPAR